MENVSYFQVRETGFYYLMLPEISIEKIGNMTFEMGKQYTFDIVVSLPGIEVNLKEIEDWDVETFYD